MLQRAETNTVAIQLLIETYVNKVWGHRPQRDATCVNEVHMVNIWNGLRALWLLAPRFSQKSGSVTRLREKQFNNRVRASVPRASAPIRASSCFLISAAIIGIPLFVRAVNMDKPDPTPPTVTDPPPPTKKRTPGARRTKRMNENQDESENDEASVSESNRVRPPKKQKTSEKDNGTSDDASAPAEPKRNKKAEKRAKGEAWLEEVYYFPLPQENFDQNGNIKIYDSCDVVRNKINNLLRDRAVDGVTAAAFCRVLGGTKVVNSNVYGRFMRKKGPFAGAESSLYHFAYAFFERLRVMENRPKTATRLEGEKEWPDGRPLMDSGRVRVMMKDDETLADVVGAK
ncbi:hypothetical protein BC938DRAFT_472340 [Jimgerdemannia flammicorona]|uniref:DUF7726 domain-containing protein n=1 Tax=Jimgerdemannia flammicorona TaxID=994334 RepID=A0A433Q6B8_9FUNG|nr:hypothetical protein BC938DRAFT_472340 [Jimgerdemannia flammicorona]